MSPYNSSSSDSESVGEVNSSILASRADCAAARGRSTCWASRTAFCSFVCAAIRSGSGACVMATRESIVGVVEISDGISVDLGLSLSVLGRRGGGF